MLSPRPYKITPSEAAIIAVLANEVWYEDCRPQWIVGAGKPWERPCQTAAQARWQNTKAIERLYGPGLFDPLVRRTIQEIERCRPGRRCGNGACAECQRALSRWFVANASAAASSRSLILSIVPDYAATSAQNPSLNWTKVVDRLCQDLTNAGITRAIGGADFSINIDRVNGGNPVLQGQFWLLVEEPWSLLGKWFEDLKEAVNATGTIKRPLRRPEYTGSLASLGYAIKSEFKQRENYLKTPNPATGRAAHFNTREKKLPNDHWLSLMLFLDRIGLEGRLINHNAIACNSRGQPRVVMGEPPNAGMAGKKRLRVKGLLKGFNRRF